MNNYLEVVYDETLRPSTSYPEKLVTFLFDKFKMKPEEKILEVGCGRGEFIREFQQLGMKCSALDSSPSAGSHMDRIPLGIANVEVDVWPYPSNEFDVVFSKSLIEHLSDPLSYLEEACRVLKPGGLLITMVPDWQANFKTYFDDFTHRTPFTKVSLNDAYLMGGFKDVVVIKFRQLPVVWKYPVINIFCALISPFVPVRTKIKFLRWSRELMLIGSGCKPNGS